jgi:4-amino-4-deoxy-L-arabinose transferase-like glycosyltransferase
VKQMSNHVKSLSGSNSTAHVSRVKIALLLFLLALIIRLAVIFFWQFDGLYGQDAYAYFQQAVAITETLSNGHPPPADFFWPNGYPLLIVLTMLFVGQTAWAGQLAVLLCGAALAPLAYLLCQDLFAKFDNRMVTRRYIGGVLAGLIIAFAGQPILSSVVIMADMPALFWATLAVWLVVRAAEFEQGGGRAGKRRRFLTPVPPLPCSPSLLFFAAGAALALAIISRWLYVLSVPALMLYVVFKYWHANPGLSGRSKASLALRQAWPAVLSGVIILAPQVWLSLNQPEGLAHSFLLGWSPAHFWQRQFENSEGHFSYLLPMSVFYAQPAGHPAYIFPLLGLVSFRAMWRLWQIKESGPLILLLGWAAPVYLFLAGISFQNFRFGLSLYVPLVILAGFGVEDLMSRSKISPAPTCPRWSTGVLLRSPAVIQAIIILSLLGMLLWAYPMLNSFLTAQNQSKIIARQVEQTLPPKATLITFNLTLTLQHYAQLNTLELFYLDENSLKTLTEASNPLYLLLDLNSIETQWQGKTPQINYQWLKENTSLSEIATFPPYVLFRVKAMKQ